MQIRTSGSWRCSNVRERSVLEVFLALPVIVWSNDALKEIVDQMDRRQIPRIGVESKSPDFLRLAESLGCRAVRAASTEHLAQSVRDALLADRPTLIEVRQDSPRLAPP